MIGLCCQFLEETTSPRGRVGHNNIFDEKSLQFGRYNQGKYSKDDIQNVWRHNVTKLKEIVPKIFQTGIKSLRISSNLFPLHDKENALLANDTSIKDGLLEVGSFVKENNMRVSCHPSQFVVLSSVKQDVVSNSVEILKHHAWIFDTMGLDSSVKYPINIHGGTKGKIKELIDVTKELPNNIKSRLTFENDEKCYNVKDLEEVWKETGVPITYDFHHATFNDAGITVDESIKIVFDSWGGIKPIMHLSNTEPEFMNSGSYVDKRKHSFYTHYVPGQLKELLNSDSCDCDWEFKGKNLAIFKAVNDFDLKL